MDIKASMLLSAYWRRRCPPQLSYHPRCPTTDRQLSDCMTFWVVVRHLGYEHLG